MQPECVTGASGWASRQSYSSRRPLALIGKNHDGPLP